MPLNVSAETPAPSKTAKRVREKAEYLIQEFETSRGWSDTLETAFDDTAQALKAIRVNGRTGRFRVVRVCATVTVKTEQKTVTKLEPA